MRFETIQQVFFFGMLATATVAFIYVVAPFLAPVFWAIVLSILFYPLYQRISIYARFPALASLGTILAILALVLIPLAIVGSLVVSESFDLYARISHSDFDAASGISKLLDRSSPYLSEFGIETWEVENKIRALAGQFSNWLASSLVSWGQVTIGILIDLFIMLYLLFFIFKDGRALETKLIRILPLGDRYERELFKKFSETARAVIKGTVLIGIAQGVLGALIFSLAGISSPILWGTLMAVLSIIPGLGAGLVWFPAAVFLILSGSIWSGLFVMLGGFILISLVDNVLRPIIVGRDTGISDPIILLSTIGGLVVFGVSGFIVGPVIAALCMTFWNFFEQKYQKELGVDD